MALRDFPKNHPWWSSFFCFCIVSLPQWIGSVWGLWSEKPLAPIVIEKLGKMEIPAFSPYLITVPLGLLMFGWLIYELRRRPQPRQSQDVVVKSVVSSEHQTDDSTLVPNWPIRELFYHIGPDLKMPITDNLCHRIGVKIMDKLSTGQMKIWGRMHEEQQRPLTAIDPSYWSHAEFTYQFLGTDDDLRFRAHVIPGSHHAEPSYQDLHVQVVPSWRGDRRQK